MFAGAEPHGPGFMGPRAHIGPREPMPAIGPMGSMWSMGPMQPMGPMRPMGFMQPMWRPMALHGAYEAVFGSCAH